MPDIRAASKALFRVRIPNKGSAAFCSARIPEYRRKVLSR